MASTKSVKQMATTHFPRNLSNLQFIVECVDDLPQIAPATFHTMQADLIISREREFKILLHVHLLWTTWCGPTTLLKAKGYTKPLS